MNGLVWAGIGLCLLNSGIFSGLNLALFHLSRLRLEAEARAGNPAAARILELRHDANFLLTTLLWGNVSVNVLLTMLSESVLTGVGAFLFSTVGITLVGEIVPQAYISRNAMRAGALLAPIVRIYQTLLYPIARPTAWALDLWLGPEAVHYFDERDLREVLEMHRAAEHTDLGDAEAHGALNFLALDDLPLAQEGEPLHPLSVIRVPDARVLPTFDRSPADPFLRAVQAAGKKWVVLTDDSGEPGLVIDADGFLRGALLEGPDFDPRAHCHRPIVVRDPSLNLGRVLGRFTVEATSPEDDVIDRDLALLWSGERRRVLTGADILGRLLRGIAAQRTAAAPSARDGVG